MRFTFENTQSSQTKVLSNATSANSTAFLTLLPACGSNRLGSFTFGELNSLSSEAISKTGSISINKTTKTNDCNESSRIEPNRSQSRIKLTVIRGVIPQNAERLSRTQDHKGPHTIETKDQARCNEFLSPTKTANKAAIKDEDDRFTDIENSPTPNTIKSKLHTLSNEGKNSSSKVEEIQTNDYTKASKRKVISPVKSVKTIDQVAQVIVQPKKRVVKQILQDDEMGNQVISRELNGLNITILGRKFTTSRSDLIEMILKKGGKISEKVTSKVTHMLCAKGEENTAKYLEAKKRSIPILNEEEFMTLMSSHSNPKNSLSAEAPKNESLTLGAHVCDSSTKCSNPLCIIAQACLLEEREESS